MVIELETMSDAINQINLLKTTMAKRGYTEEEVASFTHNIIGHKSIDELNIHECDDLICYLDIYLSFDKKQRT